MAGLGGLLIHPCTTDHLAVTTHVFQSQQTFLHCEMTSSRMYLNICIKFFSESILSERKIKNITFIARYIFASLLAKGIRPHLLFYNIVEKSNDRNLYYSEHDSS